jgi:hypothetical protein
VENWSGSGGSTNLATTYGSVSVTITSDTGTDAVINRATNTTAGIMAAVDKARLETILVFGDGTKVLTDDGTYKTRVSSVTGGTGITQTSTTGAVTLNLDAASSSTIGGVKFGTYNNISGLGWESDGDFYVNSNLLGTATPATSDYIGFYDVTGAFEKKATIADILALGGGGSMVYPGAGIAVSTGSDWSTSISPSTGYLYYNGSAYSWANPSASAVTAVNAGTLVDVSPTTGNVTVNVDLSEATSDNTFASTDEVVYLTSTTQKRGTISGLQSYMQSNLTFDSEWTAETGGINYQGGNVGIGASLSTDYRLRVHGGTSEGGIDIYTTTSYFPTLNITSSYNGLRSSVTSGVSVEGISVGSVGVKGQSTNAAGVYGTSINDYDGYFSGGIGVNSNAGFSVDETEVIDENGVLIPANLSANPSSPVAGMIYFNTTDNHFYGYNGTTWKQLDN